MKTNLYSRKKRQLSRLVDELTQHVTSNNPDSTIIYRLKTKIKYLIQEMTGFVSKIQLTRILGAFAVVFGLSNSAEAQVFFSSSSKPVWTDSPTGDLSISRIC